MSVVALISSLVLAAVFAVAAITKLADRGGTREAVVAFGAPEWSAPFLALAIPLAELAVAALLLFAETAVVGAIGALVLLAVFSVAIGVSLARGRAPDCHCFGQLHSAPASWKTLARNGVLAGLAVVSLAGNVGGEQTSAFAWLGGLDGAQLLALAVAAAAVTLLVVGAFAFLTLMRSYGQVLVRLDRVEVALAESGVELGGYEHEPEFGLEPGSPVPAFAAATVDGRELAPSSLTAGDMRALLVFTSPRCGPCATLLPTAAGWQQEYADELRLVFVSDGSPEEVRTEAEEHGLEHAVVDEGNRLYDAFQANGTPSAVLVAPDGTIGSWVAAGSERIERLFYAAVAPEPDPEGLPIGAEAPLLELPALDGELISLADLRGRDTLLIFWNPDCGYCRSMHADLLAWEASIDGEGPQLVVVSSGDAAATQAEGFRSRVVLDENYTVGTAFSASGTPMAVRIDAEGRIASDVVAGADAVLKLAGASR
jgi:thiol-disulfide isomerase/thioredoxin